MKKKISVSWSGGKDSAFALYKILTADEFEVVSLHTVFNSENRRVGMHGVHEAIIEAQASSLKIPLQKLVLNPSENHDDYVRLMTKFYRECKSNGIDAIVFGDIFLEDLKMFREKLLYEAGLTGTYPLWRIDTSTLVQDFLNVGFKTMICSANARYFNPSDMGQTMDPDFVNNLHPDVDPCGENGEFHTLVYDGPIFQQPLKISKGAVVTHNYSFRILDKDGREKDQHESFWFQELSLS